MPAIIITHPITFFPTEAGASERAEANGGAAEGFFAVPANCRYGKFVVEVRDEGDGALLSYL